MLLTNPATPLIPTSADMDLLTNLLLERETPMTTQELALWWIENALSKERQLLQARYQNTRLYTPAESYQIGDRLTFSKMEYALATVTQVRQGNNQDYGDFSVISVEFDDPLYNGQHGYRDFAAQLTQEHALNEATPQNGARTSEGETTAQAVLAAQPTLIPSLERELHANKDLRRVAGYWFPQDLVLPVDIGMLHLAEAILVMAEGKPLTTESIIEQIGGIGNAPMTLQVFSLNVALSEDKRFDEVGPSGQVLWYLHNQEPDAVKRTPSWLTYRKIDYNRDLLTEDMLLLESELDDELSQLPEADPSEEVSVYLIYPHRRAGTLPINSKTCHIFPTARTPRIYVEFIDDMDGSRFNGWVVHEHLYVYGLFDYYTKHHLPIGTRITLRRGEHDGQIHIRYEAYKARTEYIPVVQPVREQLSLMQTKRAIGADFDFQLIVGIDNLEATDELAKGFTHKNIASIIKAVIGEASKFSPQSTVHAKTIYSIANILRRCPPGLVFATLSANPEFETIGNHNWKLSE